MNQLVSGPIAGLDVRFLLAVLIDSWGTRFDPRPGKASRPPEIRCIYSYF